eukprot:TRINITY_DN11690_c1_g1_i1.p1 TRINITY_DN11690_c1_g1~~TRINITY_DN11690_c1_g1_i1.p1  ORF type:complete len:601 (+),score=197.07 TRINITY_DN11690_c1_g1_i1:46-1848(+)
MPPAEVMQVMQSPPPPPPYADGPASPAAPASAFDAAASRLLRKFAGQHISVREFTGMLSGRDEPTEPSFSKAPPARAANSARQAYTDEPPATTAALRSVRTASKARVAIDTAGSRYNVVRIAAARLGYEEAGPEQRPHVVWVDTSLSENRAARLPEGAHINHFPGMLSICRKIDSARLLSKMRRQHPAGYAFVPATFLSFEDYSRAKARQRPSPSCPAPWYIVKPDAGCMGKGIRLTASPKPEMFDRAVVQEYIPDPLLIDRCKWDMRVYVLVLSVDPLRIYVYRDGFIRLCTEKYQSPLPSNADNSLIHLTNYAIHKNSRKYKRNAENAPGRETGCKRSFSWLTEHLRKLGHDTDAFWDRISQMCVKSLLAVSDTLKFSYRNTFPDPGNLGTSCFEVLGFDVLVDQGLNPWLLEVNHAPSFSCDSDLDYGIKGALIHEALSLVGAEFEQHERQQQAALRSHERRKEFAARFRVRKDAYESRTCQRFVRAYPASKADVAKEYDEILSSLMRRTLPPQGLLYTARQLAPAPAPAPLPLPARSGYSCNGAANPRAALRSKTPGGPPPDRLDAPPRRVPTAKTRTLTTPPAYGLSVAAGKRRH